MHPNMVESGQRCPGLSWRYQPHRPPTPTNARLPASALHLTFHTASQLRSQLARCCFSARPFVSISLITLRWAEGRGQPVGRVSSGALVESISSNEGRAQMETQPRPLPAVKSSAHRGSIPQRLSAWLSCTSRHPTLLCSLLGIAAGQAHQVLVLAAGHVPVPAQLRTGRESTGHGSATQVSF